MLREMTREIGATKIVSNNRTKEMHDYVASVHTGYGFLLFLTLRARFPLLNVLWW